MNLIGRVVGRLTVVGKAEKQGSRCAWKCKCSCGAEVVVLQQSLVKRSATSSCGCLRREAAFGATLKNLRGEKIGLWTVEELSPKRKKPHGGVYWWCVCECGTRKEIAAEQLLRGSSRSCGCSKLRPVCLYGHVKAEWGGKSSGKGRGAIGECRACLKNRNYIRTYGITLDEYIALWKFQQGKCAICGDAVSIQLGRPGWNNDGCRAELDHEHNPTLAKKEQVRGVLCGGRWSGCNRKLGRLDNFQWLQAAAGYIADPPARRFFKEAEK